MPESEPHINAQDNLQRLLDARLPVAEWTIRPAHPLELRDGYKPQPDLVVLAGPRSDYRRRTPGPADAALVVEVASSTYADDSGTKLVEYARAGIPRYWIVNLTARRVESYARPSSADPDHPAYEDRRDYPLEGSVALALGRSGATAEFPPIPVAEVLRDSLDEGG